MDTPPPPPVEPPPPSAARNHRSLITGFVVAALLWSPTVITKPEIQIPFLLFAGLVLPVIAIVVSIIPQTRRFGLGLLLACGLGWLVLGAICGGVFK